MNLREIIEDAIKYPISDYRKFLIFCVLTLLISLSTIVPSYGFDDSTLVIVLTLVSLVVSFVTLGYSVDVIKSGIEGEDTLPDFDYAKQFVMGIKALILDIIYFIIPMVIVLIVASVSGLFSSFTEIVYGSIDAIANNATSLSMIAATIPQPTIDAFFNALLITGVIGIIIFIIFALMSFTALVRFAKYGSATEGLRFREIFRDMSRIGFGKIILTLIVICIIAFLMIVVISLIGLIPYVGIIIGAVLGIPFITLFAYRAIGLLYADEQS